MRYIKTFESHNDVWYRGVTTNTNYQPYTWLTENEKHAQSYANINKSTYGGEEIVNKITLPMNLNILDLSIYDMDTDMDDVEIEEFLVDVDFSDFEYIEFMDYMSDTVALSVIVNQILEDIIDEYDAFYIMESGIKTILIKTELI